MIGLIQGGFRFILKALGGSKPVPMVVKAKRGPLVIVRHRKVVLRKWR